MNTDEKNLSKNDLGIIDTQINTEDTENTENINNINNTEDTDDRKSAEYAAVRTKKKSASGRTLRKILLAALLLICAEFFRSNWYISVENIDYSSDELPSQFDGVKIVHISDYHNHGGRYDDRLIEKIEEQEPDYIFLTGDFIDSHRPDPDTAVNFLERVSKIAPCYAVWGNHEYGVPAEMLARLQQCCADNGITLVENGYAYIERGGERVLIAGDIACDYPEDEKFVIWLNHYPEDVYDIATATRQRNSQADLLFCGHAHGGLIRLPFLNGLYAPGQGFFPNYTSGRYDVLGTTMIVSRGVGNSGYTKRWGDPFHLVVCTLRSKE